MTYEPMVNDWGSIMNMSKTDMELVIERLVTRVNELEARVSRVEWGLRDDTAYKPIINAWGSR